MESEKVSSYFFLFVCSAWFSETNARLIILLFYHVPTRNNIFGDDTAEVFVFPFVMGQF